MDDDFELLRKQDPEAYRKLLNSLPDVRDGLNRRQRALLVTMNRLGLTHDARMKSTAYVSLNTPDESERDVPPVLRTHLREIRFTAIRGNASEVRALAEGRRTAGGVDADEADAVTGNGLERDAAFLKAFSEQTGLVRNGRPEMSRVTGTGCQLSGMMCAYLAANPEHPLEAAVSAVCAMGLAGELAWSRMREDEGNAAYRNRIIDAIYLMSGEELEQGGRMELL